MAVTKTDNDKLTVSGYKKEMNSREKLGWCRK